VIVSVSLNSIGKMEVEPFEMFVKKQFETDDVDTEFIDFLLDSEFVENGPRDLIDVVETESMLVLTFDSENGMYYAMGRLDRQGISLYRLGKRGSMNEIKRKVFKKRFLKNNNFNRNSETNNKIFVKALNPSNCVNEDLLWRHMNCLNDLSSVWVKDGGRYAFLSYATAASVYYTLGFFENDSFYDVQIKKSFTESKPQLGSTDEH